ncbi:MAG: GNAT family N-acetyltransferase [Lachnospiraceae bacterium]|nr:GNAT family N-acetyltransferase [Lachnospiraceae bacterium]
MKITGIDNTNIEAFGPFLSESMKKILATEGETIAIGAYDEEADNVATGVIAGEQENEAFRIRYLFVDQTRRREGIGTFLLDYLSEICLQNEISVMFAEYPDDGEYEETAKFFDSCGFDGEAAVAKDYTMRLGDVKKLKMFADIDSYKPEPQIQSFAEVKTALLKAFAGQLCLEGNTCLSELLESGELNEDISLVYTEDDRIYAVVAASVGEKEINVEWAYSDPEKYTLLLPTIKAFATHASKYNDDVEMRIIGMTTEAQGLLEGIFKDSIAKKTGWVVRTLVF